MQNRKRNRHLVEWRVMHGRGAMKKQIDVIIFDEEQYADEWPPEDGKEFIAWFIGKVETIPEEHRATAKIEISSVNSYGDAYGSIEIGYNRPETDEEEERREEQERRIRANQKDRELKKLAALKAKYEPSA